MNIYFFSIILFINVAILRASKATVPDSCVYALAVFNDGPVTLDVPVTISAFLECVNEEDKHLFVFEDDTKRKISLTGNQSAEATFVFSDKPGMRTVSVNAYLLFPEKIKVASRNTSIKVHEYIPGRLEISQVVMDNDGQRYVAANTDINITVGLRYPSRIVEESEFSFSWSIGDSRYISSQPYLVHSFADPGPKRIRASVVARIPSYDGTRVTRYKWGYFDSQLIVKNPFKNINITGNTYLQHGQLLNLDISCSGSGPVDYCWKVLPQSENPINLSCSDPVSVIECSFPIIYYFQESGDFRLAIFVNNLVSSKQRDIEIHIYDVSLSPQLSTVIIPVVCTVLALLIVVTAVVIHVRRTKRYDVETADFDFMITDESGTVVIETSWEYMHRTFLQLLRIPYIYYTTEVQKLSYGTIVHDH